MRCGLHLGSMGEAAARCGLREGQLGAVYALRWDWD